MTPARKEALQWFHDRGEVKWSDLARMDIHNRSAYRPSSNMITRLQDDKLIYATSFFPWGAISLTDKGRRALNGDYDA